ncbi:hypothetical protein SAMN05444673_4265 [Bacillus sp. OV166]|nr:hypothetical protein SAMN05444673_4265 [Bacillus sp. OV166]
MNKLGKEFHYEPAYQFYERAGTSDSKDLY